VFRVLQGHRWTLGDLFHFLFRLKDESTGDEVRRTHRHAAYVEKFLKGACDHGPATIVDVWFRSPDGVVVESSADYQLMYSTTVPYTDIKPVRPALSSFAAQTMKKKLLQEAESAVRPKINAVAGVIQKHQPLTWDYVVAICSRKPRTQNGVLPVRKYRPVDGVAVHTISSMNFSRNNEAQLLPAARGIYDFAMSVSSEVFEYNSRIGSTVAWSTVRRALQEMSRQEEKRVRECGRELANWGVLVTDNVQNYLLQRDARIGRTNTMNVGLAATYVELEDIDPKAYDLDDKQRRLTESTRSKLTVEQLYEFIDQKHLDLVMSLQWLLTLAKYIPELDYLKKHTSMLYRTRGAKLRLPDRPSKIHPLATCGKNETVTTELKDALLDFLEQTGQSAEEYQHRLMLIVGDGLTYEKVHQLKKYLQFHDDAFKSFRTIEPGLAAWHTGWTDMSRIYESHWDDSLSRDPSSLGHSASKIGRTAPPSLKKVDYYPFSELAYLVADIRMLDCWRIHFGTNDIFQYFTDLATRNALPDLEEFEEIARKLHRAYSSTRAIHRALADVTLDSDWAKTVPQGTAWTGTQAGHSTGDTTPVNDGAATKKPRHAKQQGEPSSMEPFRGDLVLAKEIAYLRDTILSREGALATAEGDVGRVYEAMKIMLFTFAGSSHTKYVNYLLEQITSLELESSPELRDATLRSMLVNLTGQPGSFCALDFMQEYFNRLLEAVVQRKGMEYGAPYIRTVISRNLHHFGRIKKEFREGVGLAVRSGRHTAPHTRPEVKVLLQVYQQSELHYRRTGRIIGDQD
ncbi:hypothetical protein BV22DRAFT_996910, partial [Leucogyrophana mollusca]